VPVAHPGDDVVSIGQRVARAMPPGICRICEMTRNVRLTREPMVRFVAAHRQANMLLQGMCACRNTEQFDMTTRKNVKPVESTTDETTESQMDRSGISGPQPAGRIVHDDRGNAIWKWGGDTSTTHTTSGILKHLDPNDLKVEGQGGAAPGSSRTPTRVPDAGGGYDPYNQGEPRAKTGIPKKGSGGKR
jgi:hypothetical protein